MDVDKKGGRIQQKWRTEKREENGMNASSLLVEGPPTKQRPGWRKSPK